MNMTEKNMDKYFQKMTIKDLRNFCLSANSELENKLKDELKAVAGGQCEVRIKDVEVTEE